MKTKQNKLTLKSALVLGKNLCKQYDVDFQIDNEFNALGRPCFHKNTIFVNYKQIRNLRSQDKLDKGSLLLSVICHEIAHFLLYRNRKFQQFHRAATTTIPKNLKQRRIWYWNFKKTAYLAENYTEDVGELLYLKHFAECNFNKYTRSYHRDEQTRIEALNRLREWCQEDEENFLYRRSLDKFKNKLKKIKTKCQLNSK